MKEKKMETRKLTALERLHTKREQLKREEKELIVVLDNHFNYLQEHFGSLLAQSGINALKSKLPPSIQLFFPSDNTNEKVQPENCKKSKGGVLNTITEQALDIAPILFNGIKPMLITFALKKAKNLLFRKKA